MSKTITWCLRTRVHSTHVAALPPRRLLGAGARTCLNWHGPEGYHWVRFDLRKLESGLRNWFINPSFPPCILVLSWRIIRVNKFKFLRLFPCQSGPKLLPGAFGLEFIQQTWPRYLREDFSEPVHSHDLTDIGPRGTVGFVLTSGSWNKVLEIDLLKLRCFFL